VIYAGQGVHYARAWPELRRLAELLAAPVTTSLGGKSAFPETHPLALGSGGLAYPATVHHFLKEADLILGIGCSFTTTNYGIAMPKGKTIIHNTVDATDVNKDQGSALAVLGDAKLTLAALIEEVSRTQKSPRDPAAVAKEIKDIYDPWLAKWMPKLTHDGAPYSPYRVIWDLLHTVDVANTIITHDAGSPRDQLSPFWKCTTPLSTSAGARPRNSVTASGSRWGRSSPSPTSSASTCGAMPRSASPAWTSRPRCASASRSCRSCSTTSRWRSS
jgi:acetolactate synthase-1/2/3 large subunit